MEERTVEGYIFIGTAVRFLMEMREGHPVFGAAHCAENISSLEAYLDVYEFHVTARVAGPLVDFKTSKVNLAAEHSEEPDWETAQKLTKEEARDIVATAQVVRETLIAEARGKLAFIASDKRFTVEKLISGVESLFGVGVFTELPDLAKFDFEEGGKAIAFDLYTAAAFHILRGTEAVLRDFYVRVVRQKRIAEPRMWHGMVQHLRGKRNAPAVLLLDNLDSLRTHFRNPTQHPEKVYDLDEVQDLLSLAVDSVNRMVRHLKDKGL